MEFTTRRDTVYIIAIATKYLFTKSAICGMASCLVQVVNLLNDTSSTHFFIFT